MIVKGKEIGSGKPIICVPVMDSKACDIIAECKDLVSKGACMIEWRVDAFEEADSLNAIREVLEELREVLADTILVFTYRSKIQGGLGCHDEKHIYDIRQVGAESKVADFIDVEFFASKNPTREIAALKAHGAKVIASHHDFEETPEARVINGILNDMKKGNADIVKIALMPNDIDDVLVVLNETARFRKEYPTTPIITMSMGKLGGISRIAGEYFGSCVTFGAGKCASAPGQFEMKTLEKLLDTLHNSLED